MPRIGDREILRWKMLVLYPLTCSYNKSFHTDNSLQPTLTLGVYHLLSAQHRGGIGSKDRKAFSHHHAKPHVNKQRLI